jgi:hypothetical protein
MPELERKKKELEYLRSLNKPLNPKEWDDHFEKHFSNRRELILKLENERKHQWKKIEEENK